MFANAPNKKKTTMAFCEGAESSNSATIVLICNEYTMSMMNITAGCRRVNKE